MAGTMKIATERPYAPDPAEVRADAEAMSKVAADRIRREIAAERKARDARPITARADVADHRIDTRRQSEPASSGNYRKTALPMSDERRLPDLES